MRLHVIILAAGKGTRMKSRLPKVLHLLAGKPLLQHVITTARQLNPARIHIVYGHGGAQVKSQFDAGDIQWVHQRRQLGTGHAVQLALENIPAEQQVCVLYGDAPMLSATTLKRLAQAPGELAILTARVDDPDGYGRIIRDHHGAVEAVIEEKDASPEQRRITEINSGVMAGNAGLIARLLRRIDADNNQGEIYLPDIIALAARASENMATHTASGLEVSGVNDKRQLAIMERVYQRQLAETLMRDGVTLYDRDRLDVRGELSCGKDVRIDVNCIIEGKVELQDGVSVGANVYLKNCTIGSATMIKANCVIEESVVGANVIVGPFARLRPGARLNDAVRVGNFVEIKQATIGDNAKINHLSYIGDCVVGERVNIGAGTITCNYDGAAKHQTTIKDDVFIGSGVELVAPIEIGDGATIGAGSTLSANVADNVLVVERGEARVIKNWRRPKKK